MLDTLDPLRTISKRGLLTGGGAALALLPFAARAATAPGLPESGVLRFTVSRNNHPIGTHILTFGNTGTNIGDTLDIHFEVDLRVGVGFITLYRYQHRGIERWRGGAFASLETNTNDNGKRFSVRALRTPTGVSVQTGDAPELLAPPAARPLTHWAIAQPGDVLFNPQTGKLLGETPVAAGAGTVTLANGQPIRATSYAIAGANPIKDWYDADKIWAALDGRGRDGSMITYRRA